MSDGKAHSDHPADLRRQAEEKAAQEAARIPEDLASLSPEEQRRLLHELRVHQIELEMQNDELRAAQVRLETSRERYFDLYDLAPVGYVTISEEGLIQEANLTVATMLGVERRSLAGQPLTRFIESEDQDIYYRHRKRLFETGEPQVSELCMRHADGTRFWARVETAVGSEPGGGPVCWAVISDITERKRAEDALRRALATQEAIFKGSRDAVFISDADSRFVAVNASACELTGYSTEELLSMRIPDLHEEADLHAYQSHHDRIMAGAEVMSEAQILRKDGRKVDTEFSNRRFLLDKKPLMHTTAHDITERKRAEEVLRASEERYRDLVENASDLICTHDLEGVLLSVNAAAARSVGVAPEDIVGHNLRDLLPGDAREGFDTYLKAIARDRVATGFMKILTRARKVRYWEYRNTLRTEGVEWPVVRGMARDVTEQVLARRDLKRSEEKYRSILESIEESYYEVDIAGNLTFFNDSLCRLLGYSRNELHGMNDRGYTDTANARKLYEAFSAVYRTGEPARGFDCEIIRKDGASRVVEASIALRRDTSGEPIGFRGIIRDVTEQKRAEDALRESEARFRQSIEAFDDGFVLIDEQGLVIEWNAALERIYGIKRADALGKPLWDVEWGLYLPERRTPELYEFQKRSILDTVQTGRLPSLPGEIELLAVDGQRRTVAQSVFRNKTGKGFRVGLVTRDITERKQAESALAHSRAQLVQSQKLEAVGRLAGGVAHDFNNILQAMLSLATVLRLKAGSPELAKIVGEIEAHIKRGAGLTQQLLLFSRRQIAERKRLDLGELTSAAAALLRRLIPENIRLAVETAPGHLWVDGDEGQLQQVVVNLAVNAKDAMPSGGTLTVRTHGGDGEAVLEVVDTGHGMDEETRSRLFEPFFTTKEAGKGTGLGLSVVHGIVEQHGGRVEIESAPGEGSVLRITLPLAAGAEEAAREPSGETELPRGHDERVLIVEDEEGARRGLAELLAMLGYEVVAVGSGEEAGILPAEPAPDLLLTDLMLPGIDGAGLAAGLRGRWPNLKVVLMSGYTEDEAVRRGVDEGSLRFLQKPFDMAKLARMIRAALAGPAPVEGARP